MNEATCDIHDVTKTANNLVSYGSSLGRKHSFDSVMKSRFSLRIATFANGVIKDVHEGTISAWQGAQELLAEYEALRAKAWFYTKNGIGVAAGAMQVRTGAAILVTPVVNVVGSGLGVGLVAHGTNNIYEGAINLYNGPDAPETVGPTRKLYRHFLNDCGDTAYYSVDLALSGYSLYRRVRKPDSMQLFRRDPMNYEKAYKPMLKNNAGRLALLFESIVDGITLKNLYDVKTCQLIPSMN